MASLALFLRDLDAASSAALHGDLGDGAEIPPAPFPISRLRSFAVEEVGLKRVCVMYSIFRGPDGETWQTAI